MRFGRELNASDDRGLFVEGTDGHLVVEGKHLSPFRVALDEVRKAVPRDAMARLSMANAVEHARIAYRDVASAHNRLTLIAAVLPADTITTHTVFVSKTPLDAGARHVLCALLNSLVANWYVRHWVGTHVTTSLVHRLPLPCPSPATPVFERLVALATRCTADGDAGDAYVTLQAVCAWLYELDAGDLNDVLSSFPLIDAGVRQRIADAFAREGRRRA